MKRVRGNLCIGPHGFQPCNGAAIPNFPERLQGAIERANRKARDAQSNARASVTFDRKPSARLDAVAARASRIVQNLMAVQRAVKKASGAPEKFSHRLMFRDRNRK